MRNYVDFRLEAHQAGKLDNATISRLRQLQEQIWAQAVAAEKKHSGPPSAAPLMQSLTEVIDVHGERTLSGIQSRIPFRVWLIQYGIMILAIAAAGYLAGLAGARRSVAALAYAVVFAAVIVMIAAGDVPGPEQSRTNHQTLINLRSRLTLPRTVTDLNQFSKGDHETTAKQNH